ncbi:hypothetical protein [Luteolibacter sp. LG18]|uniref:hypothetical protein n=1 Tax=Luteolibacter sp. LG18 TaxID=2819286 RepID=UPI002B29F76B|nr:hypothetical protein llg_34560 [Luteolibacter sp. LG18]
MSPQQESTPALKLSRNGIRNGMVGIAAALLLAALFISRTGSRKPQAGHEGHPDRSKDHAGQTEIATEDSSRRISDPRNAKEPPVLNLSGSDAPRAFAIHDQSRQHLKDLEGKRAKPFSQYVDDAGNSTCCSLLKKPDAEELDTMFDQYLQSLSPEDRDFVEKTGLSSNLRKEMEEFFNYDSTYRYVTFSVAADSKSPLPSVMVIESDKLYDAEAASKGKLDLPLDEISVREWTDLSPGDPKLDRYGHLFSIK